MEVDGDDEEVEQSNEEANEMEQDVHEEGEVEVMHRKSWRGKSSGVRKKRSDKKNEAIRNDDTER